jgi:hypothetical protein
MDNTNYSSEAVFSLEAEQAVLGSILMDPACMPQVQVYLSADDFYLPQHRAIYTAIATIEASGGKIDPLIVLDSLVKDKVYDTAERTIFSSFHSAFRQPQTLSHTQRLLRRNSTYAL